MSNVKINKEDCKSCSLCIKACPKGVITIGHESNKAGYFAAEPTFLDKCIGCSMCAVMCPDCCIEVEG